MDNKFQESLNTICDWIESRTFAICEDNSIVPELLDKSNSYYEVKKNLQELIDKLNEIYKYIPDIDNLVKWCKADKLQTIGKEIIKEGSKMKGEVIEGDK